MTPKLKLSIIIPTYKREELLNKTLAALAMQTHAPYQVIVVSNGSRDKGTDAVVLAYKNRLPIFYYHEKKEGPSHARNVGLTHATGTVIAFLDDDCIVPRSWVAEIEKTYKEDTFDHVIFQEAWTHVFPNTNIITEMFYFRQKQQKKPTKKLHGYVVTNEAHAGCCFMKRKVLNKLSYVFDEQLFPFIGEEVDFSVRAQLLGIPILLHPRVRVTHYKQSARSAFKTFRNVFLYGRALGIIEEKYRVSSAALRVFAHERRVIQRIQFPVYTGNIHTFFTQYKDKPLWWKLFAQLFEMTRSFMIGIGHWYGQLWYQTKKSSFAKNY